MKSVLIFSNPFGYGPSGKAISIAKYLSEHASNTNLLICGSKHLLSIAGNKFVNKDVDDRNEESIIKILNSIYGSKYLISSQNRFAIKAAKKCHIPSAFLDGLAWFWQEIPEEHFLADIVFWINYPGIKNKVPANQKNKIIIVNGITEDLEGSTSNARSGIVFYLGGCKNPLTPIPHSYLDLAAELLRHALSESFRISISTDLESQKYLSRYPKVAERVKISNHTDFLKRIARSELLITNGGQTTAMEAVSLNTPISFFLPVNLSQESLINKILLDDKNYPSLRWNKYITLSPTLFLYSEKEALKYFEESSKVILTDRKRLKLLQSDFLRLLTQQKSIPSPKILKILGASGAEDIFRVLKEKWNLN